MTITIHLVRHAEGFHNLTTINQQIPDPYLTPTGKAQCAALHAAFPHHARVSHLVASPMRRTLQTCQLGFRPHPPSAGPSSERAAPAAAPIIALPLVQEVSTLPCDTGSTPAMLAAEFGAGVDLSLVDAGWTDKARAGSPWAPRIAAIEERARAARVWLRELGRRWVDGDDDDNAKGGASSSRSADIVVVTHGGFLHFLTQDWDGIDITRGTSWDNAEYRSFEFDEPTGDDPVARLTETKPSWRRRRGSATALSSEEQQQRRAVVIEAYRRHFEIDSTSTSTSSSGGGGGGGGDGGKAP